MQLVVSNIGWDAAEENSILQALQAHDVHGIEVAPTKIWPGWVGATVEAAAAVRNRLEDLGFVIFAMQSVLFERPNLRLFSDNTECFALREHLLMVGRLACALGARLIVFGSPRNRDRGDLALDVAMDRAVSFLSDLGADFAELGVCLCIEANPPAYGCNFITHWSEAAELVRRVGSPGIGLHLDVGCIMLAGDDPVAAIRDCRRSLRHFHISEPQLGPFAGPSIDHASVGKALRESGYEGCVSIEMRRQHDPLAAIDEAVRHAKRCYLGV